MSKKIKRRKRDPNRSARQLYFQLNQQGVKNPYLYVTSLINEVEKKCLEYYSAKTDKERKEILERYRVEDDILGLVC